MRYRFIQEQHDWHSVKVLCRAMKVSRSGYYEWLRRKPSERALDDARLWPKVERLHYQRREAYGALRLAKDLREQGEGCSRHRVARLKRVNQLWTQRHRRFVLTTKANPGHVHFENRLDRQFSADEPNRIWVADVTSVWTFEGWLYLAAVLDLYSRKLVGWSMGPNCKDELTAAALEMAIERRRPKRGLLHHTDRGSHYTSTRYQTILQSHGMECSMSRIANCYDNAVAESFFSSLKNELTLHRRYPTRAEAKSEIFEYVELFYNPVRRHSYLGWISPIQFEKVKARLTTCP